MIQQYVDKITSAQADFTSLFVEMMKLDNFSGDEKLEFARSFSKIIWSMDSLAFNIQHSNAGLAEKNEPPF